MKKIFGFIFIIASPIWVLIIVTLPAILITLLRGYSLELVLGLIYNIISFLYSFNISNSDHGIAERLFLYSVPGSVLKIIYWFILLLFIFLGYRMIRKTN